MNTKALRKKILALAIRGKLVPQDPNDEPATILLERIREEKRKLVKERKIKRDKNDSFIFCGDDKLHYEQFADGTVKCIEDQIPFAIPESWAWARLGTTITLSSGQDLTPDKYSDIQTGIPYIIGASCLQDEKIVVNRWTNSPQTHSYKGDLLLICKGAGVGKMAISHLEDAHIARQIMSLKTNFGLKTQYLKYVITAQLELITSQASGLIPGIRREVILSFLLPLPPLEEQLRIIMALESGLDQIFKIEQNHSDLQVLSTKAKTKILDLAIRGQLVPQDQSDEPASVLLERIQAKREELTRSGTIKQEKKESFIFRGDDNSYYEQVGDRIVCIDHEIPFSIPIGWSWTRFSELGTFTGGKTPSTGKRDYWDGSVPWITSKDMKSKYIDSSHTQLSVLGAKQMQLFPPKTLLMVVRSGILRRTFPIGLLRIDATVNQDLKALSFYCDAISEFVYLYLLSAERFILSNYLKSGTTVESIDFDKLKSLLIPLPPLAEQIRITVRVQGMHYNIKKIGMNPN